MAAWHEPAPQSRPWSSSGRLAASSLARTSLSRTCSSLPERCDRELEVCCFRPVIGFKQEKPDPAVVVFLDVDGVLHGLGAYQLFHEPCMRAFEQIVMASNAKVVLSSNWRLKPKARAMLQSVLQGRGLAGVADDTPDMSAKTHRREEEIISWLRRHQEVKHWVALDDMDLARCDSPHRSLVCAHFLRTDSETGLLEGWHVTAALQMLQNPKGDVENSLSNRHKLHSRREWQMQMLTPLEPYKQGKWQKLRGGRTRSFQGIRRSAMVV
eukprot:TRINITY_DN51697_c0_g1_i1.p1 TRINITY_DN51697_c0_g1~~TRINITY_DN51697_c0_g1_i1.p1  ORF type:complete len:275 (+),score=33.00 TRINITY_DN51697_c0_g1_i1:24-827(+)